MSESRGLIASFTEHKVASNLLMILMIMLGVLGLTRLNTQDRKSTRLNSSH